MKFNRVGDPGSTENDRRNPLPSPNARINRLVELGYCSSNFVLGFWIDYPKQGLTNIEGDVVITLWEAIKENEIEISYSHREPVMNSPVSIST